MTETVTRQSDPDRYEIEVDEGIAGFAQFVDHGVDRIFFHTEVGKQFGGRGLASILVRQGLDATRADGRRIVAVCPYVKNFVAKNHDWDDLLDAVTDESLAAIPRG